MRKSQTPENQPAVRYLDTKETFSHFLGSNQDKNKLKSTFILSQNRYNNLKLADTLQDVIFSDDKPIQNTMQRHDVPVFSVFLFISCLLTCP